MEFETDLDEGSMKIRKQDEKELDVLSSTLKGVHEDLKKESTQFRKGL